MSKKIMNFLFSQEDTEIMVKYDFFVFNGNDIRLSPFFIETMELCVNKKAVDRTNDIALIKLNLERQDVNINAISPSDLTTIERVLNLFFADVNEIAHSKPDLGRWL